MSRLIKIHTICQYVNDFELKKKPPDNNGHSKIQSWKSPLQNLKGKRVKMSDYFG